MNPIINKASQHKLDLINAYNVWRVRIPEASRILNPKEASLIDCYVKIIQDVKDSNSVVWTTDITELCMNCAATIPEDTKLQDVKVGQSEIWTFETPFREDGREYDTVGMVIHVFPNSVAFISFGYDDHNDLLPYNLFEIGLEEDIESAFKRLATIYYNADSYDKADIVGALGRNKAMYKLYLACQVWRESKLMQVDTKQPERHFKKRAAKRTSKTEVHVITLRKPQVEITQNQQVTSKEYSCRWIVSGHFRRQWYPSANKHSLIFIHPFIKGPEDKPLKERTETFIVAAR